MRRLKKLSKSHSVTGTSENDAAATATTTTAAAAAVTDSNGGSSSTATTSLSKETLLNTDIFRHFDKTGRSELYVYTPQKYVSKNLAVTFIARV